MGYQYRGTVRDVDEPTPSRPQKLTGFDPSVCGTYAGYRRHQKWGVPACRPCMEGQAAYSRDRYVKRPPKTFNPDACGTWTGWNRHRYYDVPACEACREASREYQRARRIARKQARKLVAA